MPAGSAPLSMGKFSFLVVDLRLAFVEKSLGTLPETLATGVYLIMIIKQLNNIQYQYKIVFLYI
jgi:hypothetical protein